MAERVITKEAVERFKAYLHKEERSAGTVDNYLRNVRELAAWLVGQAVTKEQLVAWKDALQAKNLQPTTINAKLAAVGCFLRVMGWQDCQVRFLRVFANQTSPVMMSNAAFVYAKKHSKKVVMYCMDLWPACLAAGGIKETSPVYKFFGWESKRLYNKPDKILITSKMFRSYLVNQHGVESERISYLPQYAPEQFEETNFNPAPKDTIDLMFAGNVGSAQNLTVVLAAAEILRDEKCLRWHIVGDGSELENLKKEAAEKHLENVVFYGRKASSEMPRYYAHADAMLVTLMDDPFISLTLPGKVQTYMAAGKPIIASAVGETRLVIDEAKCGYCAKANDAQALADAVKKFMHSDNKVRLGKNARIYYEQHFSKRTFMDRLEKELQMN